MMKHEEGFITVTLGTFNKPNRNGHVYNMDRKKLVRRLNKLIGKSVGEIGQPGLTHTPVTYRQLFDRVTVQDRRNTAGILESYEIVDNPDGSYQVNGKVLLSKKLDWIIRDSADEPVFGIRGICKDEPGKLPIKEVDILVCFDYIPRDRR